MTPRDKASQSLEILAPGLCAAFANIFEECRAIARYAHASDAGKRRAVDSLAGYGKNVTNLSQNKKSGTF